MSHPPEDCEHCGIYHTPASLHWADVLPPRSRTWVLHDVDYFIGVLENLADVAARRELEGATAEVIDRFGQVLCRAYELRDTLQEAPPSR
jgi:hypothetical protein